MRIDILTVVPELLASPLNESILKRAQEKGLVEIHIHNIRDYTEDKHRTTDDYPFGGEAGMVMKIEPIYRCIEALKAEREYDEVIYTSPDGIRYDQHEANRLSTLDNLIILCGHYKGIDYRIREHLVTREISIGDYVLTGGEPGRLHHRRFGDPDHPRSHRGRSLGAHGLLPGQPAGTTGLHPTRRVQRLESARRAPLGQFRPNRPLEGGAGLGAHQTAAARFAERRIRLTICVTT